MKMHTILRAACILLLGAFTLHAGVPNLINYQGRLTDAQGNPVTGNRTMAVRVYDAPTGGNMTYEETIGTVAVANGTYSFRFGAAGAGIASVLTGADYVALRIDGVEEGIRSRLLASPFAIKSADAQALSGQVAQLGTDLASAKTDIENIELLPGPEGPQGPKGDTGDIGPAGPQGVAGEPGPQGPAGPEGPQGPKGDTGDVGPAGPQGVAGDTGSQGPVGPEGPQGPKGDTGDVGPAGPQGLAGEAGAQGPVGPEGPKGDTGDVGPAGPQGLVGDTGPQGPKGDTGDVGPAGPQGVAGDTGPQGPVGPEGPQGPKGDIGDVGPAGPQGLVGDTGPQGPVGSEGPQGPKGDTGDVGPAGPQGVAGETGPQGPIGPEGPAGPKGDTGATGPQGAAGSVAPLLYQPYAGGNASTTAPRPGGAIYQGSLLEGGQPVTGTRNFSIQLFDSATGGTQLFTQTIGNITVSSGVYSFEYGASGFGTALDGTNLPWIQITVNGTAQSPRQKMLAVPYALRSADAQTLSTQVSSLSGNVSTLQGQNTALTSNVTALQSQTSALGANLTSVQGQTSALSGNVSSLLAAFRVVGVTGDLVFGNITIGTTAQRQFTLANDGFSRLTVSGISFPAGFSGDWNGGVLAAGASQNVTVTFSPGVGQSYGGNITIQSDATAGTGIVFCSGNGVAPTRLVALSGDLAFGNVTTGTNATRTLGITNSGTGNLTVAGVSYPAGFSGNWSGSIAPGATQNVTVVFAPMAVQSYGGNLVVSSDATGGSGVLALSGAGVAPASSGNMVTVQGGTLPQSSGLAGQSVATFEIGKYEVTWDEWQEMRTWALSNGYGDFTTGGGSAADHPVRNVNWYDVVKYCNARSEREGLVPVYRVSGEVYRSGESAPTLQSGANGYRLPTEAEWEWAARGGVSSQGYTYSGSSDVNAVAWYWNNSSGAAVNLSGGRGTWPVGQKAANEIGIHDMSGNVWEWCEELVYGSSRRIRGGGWGSDAAGAAVAYRGHDYGPGSRLLGIGFRMARSSGL